MNRDLLAARLERSFESTEGERRVVVRQAGDLHDSGRFREVRGSELGIDDVVSNLREAPDDLGLVEKWNWWMGALDLAHGGFDAFVVRRYLDD